MDIQEFIDAQKYSNFVKRGGVPYLLGKWERTTKRIPYNSNYLDDDYLGDLQAREILRDIAANCMIDVASLQLLNDIDTVFKSKTIEVDTCVWGATPDIKNEYNKIEHWFYFRVPPERIPDWYSSDSHEMAVWEKWKKGHSDECSVNTIHTRGKRIA